MAHVAPAYYFLQPGEDPSRPLTTGLRLDEDQGVWRRTTGETVAAAEVGERRQDELTALQFEKAQTARALTQQPLVHDRRTGTFYERTDEGLKAIPAGEAAGREAADLGVVGEARDGQPEAEPQPVLRDERTGLHYEAAEGGALRTLGGNAVADGSRPSTFLEQLAAEQRAAGVRTEDVRDVRPPEEVYRKAPEVTL